MQPHIRDAREFRFDRKWQWAALLKFHQVQETIIGLAGARRAADVRLLQAFAERADGTAFPVGQVLLACGFPFIRDWDAPSDLPLVPRRRAAIRRCTPPALHPT